jgi:hypothetical protein
VQLSPGLLGLKIDTTDVLMAINLQFLQAARSFFPLRRPQEEVAQIVRMKIPDIPSSACFFIPLQPVGLRHQFKALVVSKGYQKVIITTTPVNRARRL